MVEQMATATVVDLMIESKAINTCDMDLAAAGLEGTRPTQTTDRIDFVPDGAAPTTSGIDSLRATVIRTSSGAQAPPVSPFT